MFAVTTPDFIGFPVHVRGRIYLKRWTLDCQGQRKKKLALVTPFEIVRRFDRFLEHRYSIY